MKKTEKENYKKYIKEFDPSLKDEYIENLVDFLYKRSNLYVDKIGLWIAYNDCHGDLRHGRIENVEGDNLRLKKKNGCLDYINHKEVLGWCNKPTKNNKNPEIHPFKNPF